MDWLHWVLLGWAVVATLGWVAAGALVVIFGRAMPVYRR
jgi:hypothetical protein